MSEATEGKEPSSLVESEKVATSKIRDILKGDLLYHNTPRENLSGILKEGLLSKEEARKRGVEFSNMWKQSSPDFAYLYQQSDNPVENKRMLIAGCMPVSLQKRSVAVLLSQEGVETVPAAPVFHGSNEEKQKMVRGSIPVQNVLGVVTLVGFKVDNENDKSCIDDVVSCIKKQGSEDPRKAVPVYDQDGNVLWPIAKKRNEILTEEK